MAVNTGAGTRLSVGPILSADLPKDEEEAKTLLKGLTYVEVGEIESIGDYGDEDSDVTFTALSDGRVRHLKGASDAGTTTLTVGIDRDDAGQIAMADAKRSRSRYDYPFMIKYEDGDIDYFVGKVMSDRKATVENSTILMRNYSIGINSEVYEVAPGP